MPLPLAAADLGQTLTFMRGFICGGSDSLKTYDDLLAIYRSCRDWWKDEGDADDLRIIPYAKKMRDGQWCGDIVLTRHS